jgi:hypothetical protein
MNVSKHNHEKKYGNHAAVWQLLPWYINGTLSGEEKQVVTMHTNVCLVCHKELGLQRALRETVREAELDDVMMSAAFERLSAQIAAGSGPTAYLNGGMVSKWLALADRMLPKWPLEPLAAAAALVLAVGLAFPVFNDAPLFVNNTFRTLSSTTVEPNIASANLRIIFAEDSSVSERAAILNATDLTAVSGPDERGLYYVKTRQQTPEATAAALVQLRANAQIEFAESVLATPSAQ